MLVYVGSTTRVYEDPVTDTVAPSPSLVSQLSALAVGETFTLSRRLDPSSNGNDLIAAKDRLHDTGRAAMGRARRGNATEMTFIGEIGSWVTKSGHQIAAFAMTRTA